MPGWHPSKTWAVPGTTPENTPRQTIDDVASGQCGRRSAEPVVDCMRMALGLQHRMLSCRSVDIITSLKRHSHVNVRMASFTGQRARP
eukprot:919534-Amphidinium_carterae.1